GETGRARAGTQRGRPGGGVLRRGPRPRLSLDRMAVRARWLVLGAYVGAIYGTLPYGPGVGRMAMRSRPGGRLLGSGMGVVAAVAAAGTVALLVARRPPRAA